MQNATKHKKPKFCGSKTVAGKVDSHGLAVWRHGRIKCKAWTCPTCGPKRARKLKKAIIQQAQAKELKRLMTLTLDPGKCPAKESAAYIKACWAEMRTYIRRKTGSPITFIWVLERQANGYAHLHILVDRYLSHAWVKQAWQAVGGGRIVDLRQVQMERAAGYLSKYLTKDLGASGIAKGQRRYGNSRNIHLFAKPAKTGWKILWGGLPHLRQSLAAWVIAEGLDEEAKLGWFETLHPPEDILGPFSFPLVSLAGA